MKEWFYRMFGKESSFPFKIIYCFIIALIIVLWIDFRSHLFDDFTLNNYFTALAVFVSICFTLFSIFDYIMVNLISYFKHRKKYQFPNKVAVVSGVKWMFDPRKNKMIKVEDQMLNPALIMYDLMIRSDKKVRHDPYIRDMIIKLANYCDEKIEVK